jgi:hypothetical protein
MSELREGRFDLREISELREGRFDPRGRRLGEYL